MNQLKEKNNTIIVGVKGRFGVIGPVCIKKWYSEIEVVKAEREKAERELQEAQQKLQKLQQMGVMP